MKMTLMMYTSMIVRTYDELITIPTFEERFKYLQLYGMVGESTFGHDRIFNQMFYHSDEWKAARRKVILRDLGHDLGMKEDEYEIMGMIFVHHMNPISIDDLKYKTKYLLDLNFLISTSDNTHRAIHYGDQSLLNVKPINRSPHDTCPWK